MTLPFAENCDPMGLYNCLFAHASSFLQSNGFYTAQQLLQVIQTDNGFQVSKFTSNLRKVTLVGLTPSGLAMQFPDKKTKITFSRDDWIKFTFLARMKAKIVPCWIKR